MSALNRRTNGDLVAPVVERARKLAVELARGVREHPDEAAVAIAPWLVLTLATKRHKLNFAEAALIAECAFWSGFFAVEFYRSWKDKPAGSPPRLRKVTLCRTRSGSSWPGSSPSA